MDDFSMPVEVHGYTRDGDTVTLYMMANGNKPFRMEMPYGKAAQKIMDEYDKRMDIVNNSPFVWTANNVKFSDGAFKELRGDGCSDG